MSEFILLGTYNYGHCSEYSRNSWIFKSKCQMHSSFVDRWSYTEAGSRILEISTEISRGDWFIDRLDTTDERERRNHAQLKRPVLRNCTSFPPTAREWSYNTQCRLNSRWFLHIIIKYVYLYSYSLYKSLIYIIEYSEIKEWLLLNI